MLIGIDASRAAAALRTGTENYSVYLIQALIRQGQRHRFRLYMNQLPSTELFPNNDRVEWRRLPFPRFWTHIRLSWEMIWNAPDLLFVPSHVLPLIHPRCSVVTVHDLGYKHHPEAHPASSRWYLDWSTRFNARAAKRVIVDSQATADDLIRFYGTDRAKMVLAYPAGLEGMAPVRDASLLDAMRAKYGTGQRYLLHLGTLQPRKNLDTLVRAFEVLVENSRIAEDINLVLAGRRGWLVESLLELISASPVRDRIIMPGYVEQGDTPALLSGALAYVLPSWYEGFGLPVLEAMACDVPVICSNVSSLPEVAGDAALLFAPGDTEALTAAIEQVCADTSLRKDLLRRGRENVKRFDWDRCAGVVLAAMEDAFGES